MMTTFFGFLDTIPIRKTFERELYRIRGLRLNEYINRVEPEDFICCAFPFNLSTSYDWKQIDDKWREYLRQHRDEFELHKIKCRLKEKAQRLGISPDCPKD